MLQAFASGLLKTLRTSDVACRYGGEEFAAILRSTSADQALIAAERIRQAAEQLSLNVRGQRVQITVSVGVASSDPDSAGMRACAPTALVETADRALYEAKRGGRNRVVLKRPEAA